MYLQLYSTTKTSPLSPFSIYMNRYPSSRELSLNRNTIAIKSHIFAFLTDDIIYHIIKRLGIYDINHLARKVGVLTYNIDNASCTNNFKKLCKAYVRYVSVNINSKIIVGTKQWEAQHPNISVDIVQIAYELSDLLSANVSIDSLTMSECLAHGLFEITKPMIFNNDFCDISYHDVCKIAIHKNLEYIRLMMMFDDVRAVYKKSHRRYLLDKLNAKSKRRPLTCWQMVYSCFSYCYDYIWMHFVWRR